MIGTMKDKTKQITPDLMRIRILEEAIGPENLKKIDSWGEPIYLSEVKENSQMSGELYSKTLKQLKKEGLMEEVDITKIRTAQEIITNGLLFHSFYRITPRGEEALILEKSRITL